MRQTGQLCNRSNEPSGEYQKRFESSYVRLVRTAYHAIKQVDPEVAVALGGSTSGGGSIAWFDRVLEILSRDPACPTGCFDIFDYHTYGFMEEYQEVFAGGLEKPPTRHEDFRQILQRHRFDSKLLFIKEGATYSGTNEAGEKKHGRRLTLQPPFS